MADFSKFIPKEMQERMKRQKEQVLAQVRENCDFLGIEYNKGLDGHAAEIVNAAKNMKQCQQCKYDLQTAMDCTLAVNREVMSDDFTKFGVSLPTCKLYRAAIKQRHVQRLLGESGLGKRFVQRTFANFKVTAQTKEAFDVCKKFCDSFKEDSKGIKLYGGYGCGKTHLAASIINQLAEKGIAGVFVGVPELLSAIRKGYERKDDSADKIMKTAERAVLLVLDDLGAEKTTAWVQEQLYLIINHRYENMLPTIITTNCSTAELAEKVGQRTVSRVIEMTTPVRITASDYRILLAKG